MPEPGEDTSYDGLLLGSSRMYIGQLCCSEGEQKTEAVIHASRVKPFVR